MQIRLKGVSIARDCPLTTSTETLMSDPFPTEDRFEVETLKPDSETSFDSTTDQTNRLPAKYMTNHALLPGVSYGSIVGSVHVHWKYRKQGKFRRYNIFVGLDNYEI